MFAKIRERIEEKQRIKGLSRALQVVDEYMIPGLKPEALTFNYGKAYADIRMEYINGDITENEMCAALTTLENQYEKMYPAAVRAMLYA